MAGSSRIVTVLALGVPACLLALTIACFATLGTPYDPPWFGNRIRYTVTTGVGQPGTADVVYRDDRGALTEAKGVRLPWSYESGSFVWLRRRRPEITATHTGPDGCIVVVLEFDGAERGSRRACGPGSVASVAY